MAAHVPLAHHIVVVILLQARVAHNKVLVCLRYVLQHLLLDMLLLYLQRLLTVRIDNVPLKVVLLQVLLELVLRSLVSAQAVHFLALLVQVVQQLFGHIGVTRLSLVLLVDVASEILEVAVGSCVAQLELVKPFRGLLGQVQHVILKVLALLSDYLLTDHCLVTILLQRRLIPLEPILVPLLVDLVLVRVCISQLGNGAVHFLLLALIALTQLCVDAVQAVGHLIVLAITVVHGHVARSI